MGYRAQQRQELELWQVVSPPSAPERSRTTMNGQVRTKRPQSSGNRQMRTDRPQKSVNVPIRRKQEYTGRPVTRPAPNAVNPRKPGNPRPAPNAVNPRKPGNPRPAPNAVNSARARAMQKRHEARRRQVRLYRILAAVWVVALIATVAFVGQVIYQNIDIDENESKAIKSVLNDIPIIGNNSDAKKPVITEDFLTISEYNRPGTKLANVNSIFVHYTANPKTSAAQNRSYFQNLGETHERAASAHFIIGYEGEIIQCIPLDEEAYAVIDRNKDSVSIECCYINEDGSFTQETYNSLVAMLAWLTDKYNLDTKDILRHYDCGGKLCPIYYVEHEDAWNKLLDDVKNYKS